MCAWTPFLGVEPLVNEALLAPRLDSWKHFFRNMMICFITSPSFHYLQFQLSKGGEEVLTPVIGVIVRAYTEFLFYFCLWQLSACFAAIKEEIVAKESTRNVSSFICEHERVALMWAIGDTVLLLCHFPA